MSAAQGLLSSVFSCSSPASKAIAKRRLRQTRSLDPAIIRHCGADGASDAGAPPERTAARAALRARFPALSEPMAPSLSSPSIPLDVSPCSHFSFDYDAAKFAHKRNTAGDLLAFPPRGASGSTGALFSPRRWLQRKLQPCSSPPYAEWKSEVGFCFHFKKKKKKTLSTSMQLLFVP